MPISHSNNTVFGSLFKFKQAQLRSRIAYVIKHKMTENHTVKYCCVPRCKNTSTSSPNKIFIGIPKDPIIRHTWSDAMKWFDHHSKSLSVKMSKYCCEDHFNLQEDIANYTQYRLMGNVRPILKKGVIPSKFECQYKLKNKFNYVFVKLQPKKNCDRNALLADHPEIFKDFSIDNHRLKAHKKCLRPEFVSVDFLNSALECSKINKDQKKVRNGTKSNKNEEVITPTGSKDDNAPKFEKIHQCILCEKVFSEDHFLKKHVLSRHMESV